MAVFFLVGMTWNVRFPGSPEWNLRNNSCMKQLENTYKSNWKLLKSLNVWNDMHDLSVFEYWDQMSCAPVSSLCTNVLSGGSCTDSGARLSGREVPQRTEWGSFLLSAGAGGMDWEELWQEPALPPEHCSGSSCSWQWGAMPSHRAMSWGESTWATWMEHPDWTANAGHAF